MSEERNSARDRFLGEADDWEFFDEDGQPATSTAPEQFAKSKRSEADPLAEYVRARGERDKAGMADALSRFEDQDLARDLAQPLGPDSEGGEALNEYADVRQRIVTDPDAESDVMKNRHEMAVDALEIVERHLGLDVARGVSADIDLGPMGARAGYGKQAARQKPTQKGGPGKTRGDDGKFAPGGTGTKKA